MFESAVYLSYTPTSPFALMTSITHAAATIGANAIFNSDCGCYIQIVGKKKDV